MRTPTLPVAWAAKLSQAFLMICVKIQEDRHCFVCTVSHAYAA